MYMRMITTPSRLTVCLATLLMSDVCSLVLVFCDAFQVFFVLCVDGRSLIGNIQDLSPVGFLVCV